MWNPFSKNKIDKEETIQAIKQEFVKGGNMVKEEFEDVSDDETLEEMEETKPKPQKKFAKQPMPQHNEQKQQRYSVVRQQEMIAILDNFDRKYIATDVWDMLCNIKNDLEEIKRAVGS